MGLLPQLKIAQKLPLALVGSALVVSAGVGIASYMIGLNTVQDQREQSMQASLQTAASLVSDYYSDVEVDLRLFARRSDTVTAMKNLARGVSELRMAMGDKAGEILQKAYVTGNPNPEQRYLLDSANGMGGSYDAPHKRSHGGFRTLMLERGYSDVLLVSPEGEVVYSVGKNADFGANIVSNRDLAQSGLTKAFAAAKGLSADQASFADYSIYAPVGAPLSFMAMPVFDGDASIGVMVLAIAPDVMSAKVSALSGLGQSGEVVVVGSDGLLRTESPRTEASDVLQTSLTSPVVAEALAGHTSEGTSTDYRAEPMVVRAQPVSVGNVTWAVVAAQPEAEVYAPVVRMGQLMLTIGGALLAIAAVAGYFFARSVSRSATALVSDLSLAKAP